MGILRVLVPLIFAAFLAGCAAHIPVFETQDNVTTQPDRTLTAKVISEAKKPKPPAPKPATTASTNPQDTIKSIAPTSVHRRNGKKSALRMSARSNI
jgi:hypothetical protein